MTGQERPAVAADLEAPIFLLGASWRTGSTLLQRVVTAVPGVLIWGEGSFLHHFARVFREVEQHFENVAWSWQSLESGRRHVEWIPVLCPPADDVRAGFRAFLDRVYAQTAKRLGFHRWGAKEVREDAVAAARLIGSIYPRARFVFLVRDPFATLASAMGTDFFSRFGGPEDFVSYWLRNARDFIDAEKVGGLRHLVVRYEDLIRDREDDHPELARLMRFLELPLGAAVFEALRTRAGKGTPAPLTREQHAVVEKLTAGVRERFGYG